MSSKTALLEAVGEYFHVYNRGVNRQQIFFSRSNYAYFVHLLEAFQDPQETRLHGYCLMPNHFHLILRQEQSYGVSLYVKQVCERYAKSINLWARRSGHLFQARYKLKHINSEKYLLQVSRYIHRNPIEAGLVDNLNAWEASSYADYCTEERNGFVMTDVILCQAGGRDNYRRFLMDRAAGYDEEVVRSLIDWSGEQATRQAR